MKSLELRRGEVIFSQGDPGDCMYYVRWGKVGVYADYGTPNQKKLAELGEGDYFGELGLLDGEPRSATVVALELGTMVNRIDEAEFGQFLAQNPLKVYAIIQQLSHKLRQTTKDYLEVCKSVSHAVGDDEGQVDEASDYGFEQDDQLRAIYDQSATEA
ncbi:MAG: cyclic nucleotide-binding domain-containing protein [Coriobacteriales bacterium]|nr:cyclic nucleotide-binding domain-containing protein [Coriobacteriales bacterium]